MSKKRGDVVYTPLWCAQDIMSYFSPKGKLLDPCRGEGVFYNLFPKKAAYWCEITEGKDFFNWKNPVDWSIGNPPYSLTRKWFRHTYTITEQFLYLIPLRNFFSGYGFVRELHEWGGLKEIRCYGTGGRLGFPMGNAIGVLHGKRNYCGTTNITFFDDL